MKERRKIK